jgi:hypothetical protein
LIDDWVSASSRNAHYQREIFFSNNPLLEYFSASNKRMKR